MLKKAGPDIEKALDPLTTVLVLKRGTTNLYKFVERRYFEHRFRIGTERLKRGP